MSYEGDEGLVHSRPLDLQASERIRTVEDDHFHPFRCRHLHHIAHGAYIGVGAAADVLDVVDNGVEALELFCGGEAGLAVEGEDGNTGAGVYGLPLDVLARVGIAPDTVLRAEKGHQLYSWRIVEDIDGGVEVAVHARWIGHQSDAFALELFEAVGLEDVNAGEDGLG